MRVLIKYKSKYLLTYAIIAIAQREKLMYSHLICLRESLYIW